MPLPLQLPLLLSDTTPDARPPSIQSPRPGVSAQEVRDYERARLSIQVCVHINNMQALISYYECVEAWEQEKVSLPLSLPYDKLQGKLSEAR